METREALLQHLNEAVAQLLDVYQNVANLDIVVYEGWTAKDILGHITFWHESFARNVSDLVNDIKPTPLKGKFIDLNQRGVDEMRQYPLQAVIERLAIAHRIIQDNILNPKLASIPYRKGSRDYTPEEHLDIVRGHIEEHVRGIKAASKEISVKAP